MSSAVISASDSARSEHSEVGQTLAKQLAHLIVAVASGRRGSDYAVATLASVAVASMASAGKARSSSTNGWSLFMVVRVRRRTAPDRGQRTDGSSSRRRECMTDSPLGRSMATERDT